MTYPHNPYGLCVLSSQDFDADLNYWQRLRPYSMLFTQDVFALVAPALASIPELKVAIVRTVDDAVEKTLHHGGAEGIRRMVQDFLSLCEYESLDLNRTYLYVWNEPDLNSGETPGMLQWTIDLMHYAKAKGVHCVVLNIGMATLSKERVQSGLFDALLRELTDGWHVLGIHEHAGFIPPAGCAGRSPDMYLDKDFAQQDHWPSPYDVQIGSVDGNWHIGRLFWWLARCDRLGIKHPRVIVTEFGCDDMPDLNAVTLSNGAVVNIRETLENRYARFEEHDGNNVYLRAPWPYPGIRGVDTLRWLWQDYYPQWTVARTHMEFTKWQLWMYDGMVIFQDKPHIEAALEFAHCPGHDEWDRRFGENATADAEYRLYTIDYADGIYGAVEPEPLPEPESDTPGLKLKGSPLVAFILFLFTVLSAVVVAVYNATHRTFDFITQGVQPMLGAEIFKSKRFWSAMIGIVLMVAVSFVPSLANDAETLQRGIEIIVGLLIGGYTIEQSVQAWKQ